MKEIIEKIGMAIFVVIAGCFIYGVLFTLYSLGNAIDENDSYFNEDNWDGVGNHIEI